MVWEDDTPGNWEIYYEKSTDGGATWTPSQRIACDPGPSGDPDIAVDSSGHIHVVWHDTTPGSFEIYSIKSTDGGATWTPSKRLTWNSGDSLNSVIASDPSGNLHIVWLDYESGNAELCHKKSTDGGASWTPRQRLTWNSGDSLWPAVAVDSSGHIHVVWWDLTPGNPEIYHKKSTDGGVAWTASKRLTWTSGWTDYPAIAIDGSGNPHVVWRDNTTGNEEVYYKKSTDGGSAWTTTKRLTWTSGGYRRPAIAVDSSGNLQVVWNDNTPGNYDIYGRKSTDGGATWTATQRLTWTSGSSYSPDLAVDASDDFYVIWSDDSPGNFEVYYKKGN